MFYVQTFVKLLLGLLMATAIIKITGKTTLAPQAPIDQIQNYILGGIIGGTIYSEDVTIGTFIIVMLMWATIAISFYYVRKRFSKVSELLDGKTIRVLENGRISQSGLSEASLTIDRLYSMLRTQGVNSVTKVELGTIEKNGNLSIILKESTDNSYLIISDGKINEAEMDRSGMSQSQLKKLLSKQKESTVENISLLEIGEDDSINAYQLSNDK